MGKLTAIAVKALKEPGRHGDGNGLYLVIAKGGSASWVVRVQKDGKRRDIGLGSRSKVTLAQARELAAKMRSEVQAGLDPVAARRMEAGVPSFRQAAAKVYTEQRAGWRNGKHNKQWMSSLEAYAFPAIGDMAVSEVDLPKVRDLLALIWLDKPETARRVRQRINTVLNWAVGKGYRDTALNQAVLNRSLPRQRDKSKHHDALPYSEVPAFMQRLRERESMGRLALEACILTATRSGEVRGATWDEIDLDGALWTIPATRMKAGREHSVPLSTAAVKLLRRVRALGDGSSRVFPGLHKGVPLSDMTLLKVLRDMGVTATVHGFRSSFRDWVAEQTRFPSEVAESALAHTVANRVEAAYRRTDYLEKRRELMQAWANYCSGPEPAIVRPVTGRPGRREAPADPPVLFCPLRLG